MPKVHTDFWHRSHIGTTAQQQKNSKVWS